MTILEILIIQLGPAIAKSILAFWLRDSSIAPNLNSDAISDIVDVLKTRTNDILAQRRVARQFVDIGERVAESLLPLFEREAEKLLDEASRKAIAFAIVNTFRRANIDAKLLTEINLDATKLTKHLLALYTKDMRQFTAVEQAFYERVISEASQCIVDIASNLPNFTERSISEILKREERLMNIAMQILEDVQRIRETSQTMNATITGARFEENFRKAVNVNFGEIELLGIEPSRAISAKYDLSLAYITLQVRGKTSLVHPQSPVPDKPTMEGLNNPPLSSNGNQSIHQVLSKSKRLLIVGDAGSGKSTIIRWIAVQSANLSFPDQLEHWNGTIPFIIKLRQFAHSRLPEPQDFARCTAPALSGSMPNGWVHDQLQNGRAIILIDGVDEISEAKRREIENWLNDLVSSFPEAYYVVTSRSYATNEDWLRNLNFEYAILEPMDLISIHEFIDRWHLAVEKTMIAQADENKTTYLKQLKATLKNRLQADRSLRNLASNPLLCAMLCALHRDRRQDLPTRRVDLFEAACRMLLEERDKQRGIEATEYPKLDYDQKSALLQKLAYWMLKNGLSEVTQVDAEYQFVLLIPALTKLPKDLSKPNLYRMFVQRSGIVREPTLGKMDFVHKTFLEYLAAKELIDQRDVGMLIQNAHDKLWREVVILAAGLADAKGRNDIINGLIGRGDRENQISQAMHLLAVACMETTIMLEPELQAKVEKRLGGLVPLRVAEDAKAFASAGDLAVPYLKADKTYSISIATACVRSLILIGGYAAMDSLATYANDPRFNRELGKEFLDGVSAFDKKPYTDRILSKISILSFAAIMDLPKELRLLENVTELRIQESPNLADLANIGGLDKLTNLFLLNCEKISNLIPLISLKNLSSLSVRGCISIVDLSPLMELKKLTRLSLRGCKKIRDLTPLAELHNLRDLDLANCAQLVDLTPLASLSNLRSLNLDGSPRTARSISALNHIRELKISRDWVLSDTQSMKMLKMEDQKYDYYDEHDPDQN